MPAIHRYTLARKDCIHIFCFGNEFPTKIALQLQEIFFWIDSPIIILHVFVCDSENYADKSLGNYFLENLISVTWNNVFGINFAIVSGWSVDLLSPPFWEENAWKMDLVNANCEGGGLNLVGSLVLSSQRLPWNKMQSQRPHVTRYCVTIAAIPDIARYFSMSLSEVPKCNGARCSWSSIQQFLENIHC